MHMVLNKKANEGSLKHRVYQIKQSVLTRFLLNIFRP